MTGNERPKLNRQLLEKPFEARQIKQRKGRFGDVLDYVEGHAVIQRLNDAFEGEWSFEVIAHRILKTEVLVLAKLTAGRVSKMQFGSSRITFHREGQSPTGDRVPVSLGDDLKAAATDALKKAATQLGVGLHLYGETSSREDGHAAAQDGRTPEGLNDGNRLTNRQLTAIYAIGKAKGLGPDGVSGKSEERFGKRPEELTKPEASSLIDELQAFEPSVHVPDDDVPF
ncbi:MAG: Rad52/Rad22 family DNA repair protein [Nitrospinota bacterium]